MAPLLSTLTEFGHCFFVDSNDQDRFEQAKTKLHAVMSHKENVGKPLVVLANKQDLPYAASREQITERLALNVIKSSDWYVIECSATTIQRARIGFEWLANHM